MSRFILGDCVRVMATFPDNAVDFILTDPPYLVGFRDRSGRTIAGDKTDEWLQPACNEMYRVLKKDALMVSFYGWNRVDRFMSAWKNAGFSVVGHPCGLFPAVDFPGAGVTTSRFSSPGEDIPSTKFLAINPAKNFASAPGQLPRDVVTDAPSEKSTAGRNPEEVDGRRGFRPSGEQPVGPAT